MAYAYGFGHGFGFGFGFLNFLGTLLFIIFLVWVIKYVARGGYGWRHRGRGYGPEGDEALKTARERLARGEITTEDYETIKRGLGANAQRESGPPFEGWFGGRDSALETARMRFARGEITLEEFEAIKKGLES